MRIYYGAGHEQFPPRDLLRHAQLAKLKEIRATSIAVMSCSGADPEGAIRTHGGTRPAEAALTGT